MRLISLKRGAVVAAALALLVAHATPASANTVSLEVTSGTLTVAGNSFDLTPEAGNEPPCEEKVDDVEATFDANGTWTMTGSTWSFYYQLGTPPSGQWYQFDFQLLAANGTWSGASSPYTLTSTAPNNVIVRATIYRVATGNCEKDDVACVLFARAVVTGGSTFTGTLPTAVAGDFATINMATNVAGGSNLNVASCSAPFVSFAGQSATVTGMVLTML
ncbi:MAG TPA: hypothetical protein VK507_02140 [Iamia sp.]|nr:hypothetical protein [Iamia sp.]